MMSKTELRDTLLHLLQEWLAAGPDTAGKMQRKALVGLLDQGWDREILKEELGDLILSFQKQGRQREEDFLQAALDRLTGWCAPEEQV